jgi:general stress protein YciG
MSDKPNRTHMRGFASLSKEQRYEVASRGGKAGHALGTAHKFTSAEASAAGKKGGRARQKNAASLKA